MDKEIISGLEKIVGEKDVLVGDQVRSRMIHVWYDLPIEAMCIVRPKRTEEVSKVLSFCNERGQISDDNDKVIDKHSGYIIRTIEYDNSEGFDEAGYKIVSRGVLNKDIGDVLMDMSFKPSEKLKSKDGTMINNVITTLQQQMGVSIGSYSEFVIKNVESTLDNYLPSEEAYNKQIKIAKSKGKRLGSYVDLHDEALLLLTLGYFLVATQTVMPSITTNITFRGCGPKSFVGYPLEGPGDFSALRYICCCALRLRSRTRPWQRLPRLTREKATQTLKDFMTKLKKLIDSEISLDQEIVDRLRKIDGE